MRQPRYLVMPLTAMGLVMVVFPIIDLMLQSLPLRFGNVQWRFGVQGMLGGSISFIQIGIVSLFAAAMMTEDRTKIRAAGWLAVFFMVLTLAIMASFSLDTLQVLPTVRPVAKDSFKHLAVSSVIRNLLSLIVLGTVAWSARRAANDLGGSKNRDVSEAMLARPMVKPAPAPAPAAPLRD